VGRRGSAGADLAFSVVAEGKYETFDQLVAGMEDDMLEIAELQFAHIGLINMGFYVGGYSESRSTWEAYYIGANGDRPDRLSEYSLKLEAIGGLLVQPELTSEQWQLFVTNGSLTVSDDVAVAIMNELRRTKFPAGNSSDSPEAYIVGAFIQKTLINANGITTRVIHRWPDPIGEVIDPFRGPRL
jgi:hypothetical protein